MLTARTCFRKFRSVWCTIAPRKPMQSGGRARTSPPLWIFLEASKMLMPRTCFGKFRIGTCCAQLLVRGVVCLTPCVRRGLVSCVTGWLVLARAARSENGLNFVLSFRAKNELQHYAAHSESLLHADLRRSCAPARRDTLSSNRVCPHWPHAPVRTALALTAHRSPHGTTIKTWM